ncbi:MAG: large subunit ribosomal protein L5 [Rickettsiales bacterium]|jgi:large subunit ribosomal protein L5
MSYTQELYKKNIADIKKQFSYKNNMEIPKLTKVSINVGIKAVDSDNKFLSYLSSQVSALAGQKAVLTRSRKSIATFKLREEMAIGCMVTLRGKKMYEFFDRLVYIALPRVRDFRGLSPKGFNQSGHYNFGIKEHNVFLEVDLDNILKVFGMNINIITNAKTKEESVYLLKKLNLPIK